MIAKVTASSGDGDLTVDGESQTFTFTDQNWNDPSAWVRTFRAASDEDDIHGQRTFLVEQVGGTSVDLLPDLEVTAFEQDDDEIGEFIVVSPHSLTIEPDQREEFLIKLSTRPEGPVHVKIAKFSGDPSHWIVALNATGTFQPLVFDESNYHIPQSIVMYVWPDPGNVLDPGSLIHSQWRVSQVGGSGGNYGHTSVSVNATGSDGVPDIQLSRTSLSVEVGERACFRRVAHRPSNQQSTRTGCGV